MTTAHAPQVALARWMILLALVMTMELLVRSGTVNAIFMAAPLDTAVAFIALLPQPLLSALGTTLLEVGASVVLASSIGVFVGYLLWRYKSVGKAFEPALAGLFASPLLLLYPLALVLFGRTPWALLAVAVPYAVLPIALTTRGALAGVRLTLIQAARVMGLTDRQILWHVLIPAALPGVFTGLRLGLGYLLKSIVAMEFLVNIGGLGILVSESYELLDTATMYAAIVAIILVSIAYVQLLNFGERRWIRAE